jgi:hypothetical protein
MSAITIATTSLGFAVPVLVKLVAYFAEKKEASSKKTSGLSVVHIAEASQRATAKGHMEIRASRQQDRYAYAA